LQHRQQGSQLFLVDIPVVIAVQTLEESLGARPCALSCRRSSVAASIRPPAKPAGAETTTPKPARPAAAKRPAWPAATAGTPEAGSKGTGLPRTARTARFTGLAGSATFPRSPWTARATRPVIAAVASATFTPATLEAAGTSFAALRGGPCVAAEAGRDFVAC